MANTYTQLYVQIVFAVKRRANLILPSFEEEVYKYITGIVTKLDQKLIAVNGMPDHLHVFVGMRPKISVAELTEKIKSNSSKFINNKGFIPCHFNWQEGYGAFSYGHSQMDRVAKYVMNQKEHHRRKSFRKEYLAFLKKFEVEHDENYLFDWVLDERGYERVAPPGL